MNPGTEQRRLAAIMFTDMVGYSALAQKNEALALELLEEHRRLLRGLFPRHNGTEVKTIGDAFLVEFASALEAAQCAIEIQRTLAKRNADALAERRIQVRIGIHIGDVIHREGDVYGDGVNIASRIEQLAGPSGICISMDVERQIRHALEASLVKLPAAELKNIQVPMELFRIVLPWEKQPEGGGRKTEDGGQRSEVGGRRAEIGKSQSLLTSAATRLRRAPAFVVLAIIVALGIGWWGLRQRGGPMQIRSLAVKPLDDWAEDTNQAFLSDGMTEALCSALGNISALRVPGRASVMRYKGGQKSIREMAKDLEVDAIVEGSVQRAGNRIQVNVQLIEAATDRHLWSTSLKRDLSDFFEVQSEVARAIAAEIQVRLTPEDQARLARARTANPDAIEAYLRGMQQWWLCSEAGMTNAFRYFQQAIEIEPDYAPAYAGLALAYVFASTWVGPVPASEGAPKVKAAAQRAIQMDSTLADAHVALGYARMAFDWDWKGAEEEFLRARELSPRSSLVLDGYANLLVWRGQFEEALVVMRQALQSDPLAPALHADLAWTYWVAGQFDRAIPHYRTVLKLDPNFHVSRCHLGWCYLSTGKTNEALAEFQTLVQAEPDRPWPQASLGYAYGVTGQREKGRQVLKDLEQLAQIQASQKRLVSRVPQAIVHLGLGQTNKALELVEEACQERESWIIVLVVEPPLSPLRQEPRFQALLKKMGHIK